MTLTGGWPTTASRLKYVISLTLPTHYYHVPRLSSSVRESLCLCYVLYDSWSSLLLTLGLLLTTLYALYATHDLSTMVYHLML